MNPRTVLMATVGLLSLLLASCQTARPLPPENTEIEPRMYTSFDTYPERSNSADGTFGAYGYLLFTHMPSSDQEKTRYERCLSDYRSILQSYNPQYPIARMQNTFVTFLFVREGARCLISPDSFPPGVEDVNYAVAESIVSLLNLQGSRGPVLVAFKNSYEHYVQGDKALVLDLSSCPDEDLDKGFRDWKDLITADPSAWDNINGIRIRAFFRNLIDTYGESILVFIGRPSE